MKLNTTQYKKPTTNMILCWLIFSFTPALMAQESAFQRTLPLAFLTVDALLGTTDGTIYSAEGFNGTRIFKTTPDGNTTVYASGLNGPIDMALDQAGNMFVTNFLSASISKVDINGEVTHFADTLPFPAGIVIDDSGNLYVSQYGATDPQTGLGTGDAVQLITSAGEVSIYSQGDLLSAPVGITLDETGNVFTANLHNGRIIKIDANGEQHFIARPTPPEAVFAIGHLDYAEQRLYATGIQTQALYKINPDNGRVKTKDISNRVTFPNGITYDAPSQAMVVSPGFNNVAQLVRYRVRQRN